MAIIISQKGKKTQKVDKSEFEKEGYLQNYIHENPESIPVYEIEEEKRLFVVAREFSTESGPIDALAIDKDGDIYVVETKLYKNPDKRTVVAQALDYGASLWRHNDYNEFMANINNEITKKFKVSFEEKVKTFFNIDDEQVAVMTESIKRNLQQGNIKFVILMDAIEDRLKDLIVYINQNSQFDIYAVQMEYYKFEKYEIMIPKLFGVEVKKDIGATSSSSARRKWEEKSFLEDVAAKLSKEETYAVRKLYEFSKNNAEGINWGTGTTCASFSPKFSIIGNKSLYTVRSNGKLSLNFGWLGGDESTAKYRDKFKKIIEKEKMFIIPENYKTHFPEYGIDLWRKKVDEFIDLVRNLTDK